MKEPRCIRYFKSLGEAELARDILKEEGFEAYVTEDKFYDIALKDLEMISRFRLYVEMNDIKKISQVLLAKMKKPTK